MILRNIINNHSSVSVFVLNIIEHNRILFEEYYLANIRCLIDFSIWVIILQGFSSMPSRVFLAEECDARMFNSNAMPVT
ncbi:MAG TPA: hypothetical protein VMT76_14700 [Puia sp.]|nr:hypothetical protein [Puia sp.]